MKKSISKVAAFFLTLVLGISVFYLSNISIFDWTNCFEISEKSNFDDVKVKPKRQSENLEIKLREIKETEYGFAADFEISNFTEKSYTYFAYLSNDTLEPMFSIVDFRINGEKIDEWRCGTGLIEHELKPGETKIFRATFGAQNWKKGGKIQAGFNFRKDSSNEKDYKTFWSKNLPISDELTKHLLIKKQER